MKTTIIYTAALFTLGALAEAHGGGPPGEHGPGGWHGQHDGGVQDHGKPHGHDARDVPEPPHAHLPWPNAGHEHGRLHPVQGPGNHGPEQRRRSEAHGRGGQGGPGGRGGYGGGGRGGHGGYGGFHHGQPDQEGAHKPGQQPESQQPEGQQPEGQQPEGQQPDPSAQPTTMATSVSADTASATPTPDPESA